MSGHSIHYGENMGVITHGMSGTPEWVAWQSMLARCYKSNRQSYENYGGRGIKVCDRWRVPKVGFVNFIADMGRKPIVAGRWTLERKNNDGDYTPDNCTWATMSEQNRNKRTDTEKSKEKYRRQAERFKTDPKMIEVGQITGQRLAQWNHEHPGVADSQAQREIRRARMTKYEQEHGAESRARLAKWKKDHPERMKEIGRYASHVVWHVNKNIQKLTCAYCCGKRI